jgi:serine/threonine protein phosphatase PrpC
VTAGVVRWLTAAGGSDVGRVRPNNEDAWVVAPLGAPDASSSSWREVTHDLSATAVLLAVSDGMGGVAAGEVASALVVETLLRHLPARSADWNAALREAVQLTDRAVWNAGRRPETRGMGATLTAVCVHGAAASIAEVGDSRAYLLRRGSLSRLTEDQSYAQLLVEAGVLQPAELERSPLRHVILQAMGQGHDLRVEMGRVRLAAGDRLLVCTDGLTNELAEDELRQVLGQCAAPEDACRELVARAGVRGGRDNITAIVARLDDDSGTGRPPSSPHHP